MLRRYCLAMLLMLFGWATGAAAQPTVPEYQRRVMDLTGTLSSDQRSLLEQRLADIEYQKQSLLAILIVPSTEGEPIASYGARVYRQWVVNHPTLAHGMILLIAKRDRQVQIIPSPALEATITDTLAEQTIRDEIAPHFRQGNYHLGVLAAVARLSSYMSKPPTAAEAASAAQAAALAAEAGKVSPWFLLLALLLAGCARAFLGNLPGAALGSLVVGAAIGLIWHSPVLAIIGSLLVFALAVGISWRAWGAVHRLLPASRNWSAGHVFQGGGTSGEW